MSTFLRPVIMFVAIGATSLTVTACGSSDSASGSRAASGSAADAAKSAVAVPTSTTGGQASTAAGAKRRIDVCAVIPAASAAKLSGLPMTRATTQTDLEPGKYGCAYGNDDDSVEFEVMVIDRNAVQTYDFIRSASKNPSEVGGLGDKALFDNDGTMYVLVGNNLIQVNGLKTADLCAALARPVLAALSAG